MKDSNEMKDILLQIKQLEQKKVSLKDAAEIKTINKEINALQMEYGQVRKVVKSQRLFDFSIDREYVNILNDD